MPMERLPLKNSPLPQAGRAGCPAQHVPMLRKGSQGELLNSSGPYLRMQRRRNHGFRTYCAGPLQLPGGNPPPQLLNT
jgi:hypothetical protein